MHPLMTFAENGTGFLARLPVANTVMCAWCAVASTRSANAHRRSVTHHIPHIGPNKVTEAPFAKEPRSKLKTQTRLHNTINTFTNLIRRTFEKSSDSQFPLIAYTATKTDSHSSHRADLQSPCTVDSHSFLQTPNATHS